MQQIYSAYAGGIIPAEAVHGLLLFSGKSFSFIGLIRPAHRIPVYRLSQGADISAFLQILQRFSGNTSGFSLRKRQTSFLLQSLKKPHSCPVIFSDTEG